MNCYSHFPVSALFSSTLQELFAEDVCFLAGNCGLIDYLQVNQQQFATALPSGVGVFCVLFCYVFLIYYVVLCKLESVYVFGCLHYPLSEVESFSYYSLTPNLKWPDCGMDRLLVELYEIVIFIMQTTFIQVGYWLAI